MYIFLPKESKFINNYEMALSESHNEQTSWFCRGERVRQRAGKQKAPPGARPGHLEGPGSACLLLSSPWGCCPFPQRGRGTSRP